MWSRSALVVCPAQTAARSSIQRTGIPLVLSLARPAHAHITQRYACPCGGKNLLRRENRVACWLLGRADRAAATADKPPPAGAASDAC